MAELWSAPELIVLAHADAGLHVTGDAVASARVEIGPLQQILEDAGAGIRPLFGMTEDRVKEELKMLAPSALVDIPDLSVFYHVDAPAERLEDLAAALLENEAIEAAYVKPPSEPPQLLNDIAPAAEAPPITTPDFLPRQGYLDSAPDGIDAFHAWTHPAGLGAGIRIIDLEWSWNFTHEDHRQSSGGVVAGAGSGDSNHGTAVIGEIGADDNAVGVTGICPQADLSAVAFSMPSSAAIRMAADRLNVGDIMLLEIHRAGPRHNFTPRSDQAGYVAIEWWPDDFAAIQYAVGRGIVVVEAAGNGAEDLDDPIYDTPAPGFPAGWTNPFNRTNRDSGAVIVGAGAPPEGTHGNDHGPDRSRLDFSNFGVSVDVQAWGREVTTTGYGDLQGGPDPNFWYTDSFSGTSSASPIVVGAIGCTQGILRAAGLAPLASVQTRDLLRVTGSPQQDHPDRPTTERIGNRPDLVQLIPAAIAAAQGSAPPPPPWSGRYFRFPPLTLGEDVEMWQQRMAERGWEVNIDGKYGSKSKEICRAFQAEKLLQIDGIVGPLTWAAAWTAPTE